MDHMHPFAPFVADAHVAELRRRSKRRAVRRMAIAAARARRTAGDQGS
jgi:hypothetical protein